MLSAISAVPVAVIVIYSRTLPLLLVCHGIDE